MTTIRQAKTKLTPAKDPNQSASTSEVCKTLANICLAKSVEAAQSGDLSRGLAYLRVAIAVNECLQEQKLVEEAMNA